MYTAYVILALFCIGAFADTAEEDALKKCMEDNDVKPEEMEAMRDMKESGDFSNINEKQACFATCISKEMKPADLTPEQEAAMKEVEAKCTKA